jgi:hypothetical protein
MLDAPVEGALNITLAPSTGWKWESTTRAVSSEGKAAFGGAD